MQTEAPRDSFLALLRQSIEQDTLIKLTLGKPRDPNSECRNLFARPVTLKAGRHLCLVWRHATKDITKNFSYAEGIKQVEELAGSFFLDGHLYTKEQSIELRCMPGANDRLILRTPQTNAPKRQDEHNRTKTHLIDPSSPWLHALGITNERGEPRAEMSAKYRQIQKYAELLRHLLAECGSWPMDAAEAPALRIVDMGCGKGYLTFAVAALMGAKSQVIGVERRADLALRCNEVARTMGFPQLSFIAGTIAEAPLEAADVVIALHACDTATDEALFRGIQTKARLIVAAPCCQKELRPQLKPSEVLAPALRHGIFRERQAEFVTDAMRAELLEWAGYHSKVFEFISTEHTAKNLMIAAIRKEEGGDAHATGGTLQETEAKLREFAAFYGIKQHRLAQLLGFTL